MAKGNIDRLNETLDQIPELVASYPRQFGNVSRTWLRKTILDVLRDDPYLDLNEVSEDISLGGVRLIKLSSETRIRHLKRFILLLYRIMGYHSSEQTRAYKRQIINLDEARTLSELTLQLSRGVKLATDSLHDWLIKTTAEDGGSLVHYYNQGEDQRLNDMDITVNGWCLGVSVQWIRFNATGRNDFWTWLMTAEGAGACRFVMAAQGVRYASAGVAALSDRSQKAAFALRRFGVIKESQMVSGSQPASTPEFMAQCITGGAHQMRIILVDNVGGTGHAMAADITNSYTFMDPNAGEIRFTSGAQLQTWLPKFIRRQNYQYTGIWVELYSNQPNLARVDQPREQTVEQTLRSAMEQRRKGMGY